MKLRRCDRVAAINRRQPIILQAAVATGRQQDFIADRQLLIIQRMFAKGSAVRAAFLLQPCLPLGVTRMTQSPTIAQSRITLVVMVEVRQSLKQDVDNGVSLPLRGC